MELIPIVIIAIIICYGFFLYARSCYFRGKDEGSKETADLIFNDDYLTIVLPYDTINEKVAEETARFIIAKKDEHDRRKNETRSND